MISLILASITFVATHFLLSHPLRAALVGAMGEKAFAGVYSLIAVASLGWMGFAYTTIPANELLWPVGNATWAIVSVVMLIASILFVGSLFGNPAFPDPGASMTAPSAARDVFAITRHPMLWAFTLWALAHIAVYPTFKSIVVSVAITVLSMVGAVLQDRKKHRLQPQVWPAWQQLTSFVPFAAVASGRARMVGFSLPTLLGGFVFWLIATWAHMPLSGWTAGIWRWL